MKPVSETPTEAADYAVLSTLYGTLLAGVGVGGDGSGLGTGGPGAGGTGCGVMPDRYPQAGRA
jgi:hypothetical protein